MKSFAYTLALRRAARPLRLRLPARRARPAQRQDGLARRHRPRTNLDRDSRRTASRASTAPSTGPPRTTHRVATASCSPAPMRILASTILTRRSRRADAARQLIRPNASAICGRNSGSCLLLRELGPSPKVTVLQATLHNDLIERGLPRATASTPGVVLDGGSDPLRLAEAVAPGRKPGLIRRSSGIGAPFHRTALGLVR